MRYSVAKSRLLEQKFAGWIVNDPALEGFDNLESLVRARYVFVVEIPLDVVSFYFGDIVVNGFHGTKKRQPIILVCSQHVYFGSR